MSKKIIFFIISLIIVLAIGVLIWQFWLEKTPKKYEILEKDYYCQRDEDCALIYEHCCHGCGPTDAVSIKSAENIISYWQEECLLEGYSYSMFLGISKPISFCKDSQCRMKIVPDCENICGGIGSLDKLKEEIEDHPQLHFPEIEKLGKTAEEVWLECDCGKIVNGGNQDISQGAIELENCISAYSVEDFYQKKNLPVNLLDILPKFKEPISIHPELRSAIGEVSIYRFPEATAGSDVLTTNVIVVGNQYCELNENNLKKVILPPVSKDETLTYLFFYKIVTATNNYSLPHNPIIQKSDYDEYSKDAFGIGCPLNSNVPEKDRKITEVLEEEKGYFISWIYYSPLLEAGYYQTKYFIGKDGSVKFLESNMFIKCGWGMMF